MDVVSVVAVRNRGKRESDTDYDLGRRVSFPVLRAEQKDKSVYFCIVRPRGYGQLSVECVDPRGPCLREQIAELSSRSGMHSLYTSKNEDVSQLKDQAATEEPCESGKVDNVFEEELLELMEIPLLTTRSRCSTAPARAFTALCMS